MGQMPQMPMTPAQQTQQGGIQDMLNAKLMPDTTGMGSGADLIDQSMMTDAKIAAF